MTFPQNTAELVKTAKSLRWLFPSEFCERLKVYLATGERGSHVCDYANLFRMCFCQVNQEDLPKPWSFAWVLKFSPEFLTFYECSLHQKSRPFLDLFLIETSTIFESIFVGLKRQKTVIYRKLEVLLYFILLSFFSFLSFSERRPK